MKSEDANISKEYNLVLGIFVFHNFIFSSESVNKIKRIVPVQHFANHTNFET